VQELACKVFLDLLESSIVFGIIANLADIEIDNSMSCKSSANSKYIARQYINSDFLANLAKIASNLVRDSVWEYIT